MNRNDALPTSWNESTETEEQKEISVPQTQQTKPATIRPIDEVRGILTKLESEFAKVLPEHISTERFTRVVITALQNSPNLLSLDRTSLFGACMLAAYDGLLPDGKEAALVPFKGRIKYSPMVWGIVKKIRNSGELKSVIANLVHEKDQFEYWTDDSGEHIKHRPNIFSDRGKMVGGYSMMRLKDDTVQIEVMSAQQLKDVQDCSPSSNGPWSGPFADEMRKKTIIRRLAKKCPMSSEIEAVITRDDDIYEFKKDPKESGLAGEINGVRNVSIEGDKTNSLSDLRPDTNGSVPCENKESNGQQLGSEFNQNVPETPHRTAQGMESVSEQVPQSSRGAKTKGMGMAGTSGGKVYDVPRGGLN